MTDTLELIKALPQELQEQILKEHIKIKLKEREKMGWVKVLYSLIAAPFCESNQQLVKCLYCPTAIRSDDCENSGKCNLCKRNGVDHKLDFFPLYHEEGHLDESFYRSCWMSWIGKDFSPWTVVENSTAEAFGWGEDIAEIVKEEKNRLTFLEAYCLQKRLNKYGAQKLNNIMIDAALLGANEKI